MDKKIPMVIESPDVEGIPPSGRTVVVDGSIDTVAIESMVCASVNTASPGWVAVLGTVDFYEENKPTFEMRVAPVGKWYTYVRTFTNGESDIISEAAVLDPLIPDKLVQASDIPDFCGIAPPSDASTSRCEDIVLIANGWMPKYSTESTESTDDNWQKLYDVVPGSLFRDWWLMRQRHEGIIGRIARLMTQEPQNWPSGDDATMRDYIRSCGKYEYATPEWETAICAAYISFRDGEAAIAQSGQDEETV